MKLKDIVKDSDAGITVHGSRDLEIVGISNDSRKIKSGFIFAARKGVNINSNIYISEAVSNGASAILTEDEELSGEESLKDKLKDKNITVILAKDALKAYAAVSSNFFENPAQKMRVIGVTGTNGKTTTTFLIKSILTNAEKKAGLIGTIDYETGSGIINSNNTTPDAYELNSMFNDMVNSGINYCVMEVSSHSLVQDRVHGIPYDAAVFTNLTRDHLDYHENMEDYYIAKKKLFSEILLNSVKPNKFAVINNDDFYGKRLITELREEWSALAPATAPAPEIITYGLGKDSDIFAEDISYSKGGLKFNIVFSNGYPRGHRAEPLEISSCLIGNYNVYNILAACSAAYALSIPSNIIAEGVKTLFTVPGRVEKVEIKNISAPLICVDYAHTDDALKRVLSALKDIGGGGRLFSVFGCGGDRDRGKRPLMGKHSTDIADVTIITSDNPRGEEPLSIIREIEGGIEKGTAAFIEFSDLNLNLNLNLNSNPQGLTNKVKAVLENAAQALSAETVQSGAAAAGKTASVPSRAPLHIYTIINDRADAIKAALSVATENDTVLIAGKGHEDYMIVKGRKFHFSDKEEVLKFYENSIQSDIR